MIRQKLRAAGVIMMMLGCAGTVAAFNGNVSRVDINGLTIGLDETTGNIVLLAYQPVGTLLQAESGNSGLVDVAYPLDNCPPMRLASSFSRAILRKDADGVNISWDQLGPSRSNFQLPAGSVRAEVKIRKAPDGRSIILSCRLENQSEAPVPQVIFPDLRGLLPFDGIQETALRLSRQEVRPFATPIRPADSAPFYINRGWKEYPPSGYYGPNPLRWLDFGSLKGGLSVFQKKWATPDAPTVRTHRVESQPMKMRLLWEHRTNIEKGQTWQSGEFVFTPHRGGWAKGIETFREYVNQVNPPRQLPKHVRDGLGYQTIWMIQTAELDPEKAVFRFRDLPRVARDAREHGLDEVVPWGFCTYSTMPIPLRPELGTKEEFLKALEESRKLGVNIAPFISIQIVRNMYASRYNVPTATSDWTYHPELIPNFRPYYTRYWDGASVESDNKIWQQDLDQALGQWIQDGLYSFCWDVFSSKVDDQGKSELVDLILQTRKKALTRDPESTFSAESVTSHLEAESRVLDYTWNWVDYVDAGPVLNVLKAPRLNCDVEDSPLVVKKAFSEGLYLNVMPIKPDQPNGTALVSEVPPLADALKQVAALRKQFLPYFVNGHGLGSSVLTGVSPYFVRAHQLDDRLLIAVLNDQERAGRAVLQSDLSLWLPESKAYVVKYYDSRGRLLRTSISTSRLWHGATDELRPVDLAFFEIEVSR
ncbi:MAG: hypothetical protein ACE15E_03715 [Acidobacteriota bacterium]